MQGLSIIISNLASCQDILDEVAALQEFNNLVHASVLLCGLCRHSLFVEAAVPFGRFRRMQGQSMMRPSSFE